jgi:hypothetical protein
MKQCDRRRVVQEQDFFGKYVRKCADDAPRSAIFSDVKGKVPRVEIRIMKHSSRPTKPLVRIFAYCFRYSS